MCSTPTGIGSFLDSAPKKRLQPFILMLKSEKIFNLISTNLRFLSSVIVKRGIPVKYDFPKLVRKYRIVFIATTEEVRETCINLN